MEPSVSLVHNCSSFVYKSLALCYINIWRAEYHFCTSQGRMHLTFPHKEAKWCVSYINIGTGKSVWSSLEGVTLGL